jgi:hypothetical protein
VIVIVAEPVIAHVAVHVNANPAVGVIARRRRTMSITSAGAFT